MLSSRLHLPVFFPASSGDTGMFSSAALLNGRCRRSSCILTVLATYLVSSSAISSSQNVWNVPGMFRYFVLLYQNNATSSQGLLGCRPFPWHLCCTVDVIFHISQTSPKFQIWLSTVVQEELALGFEPIRNGEEYFEWIMVFISHPMLQILMNCTSLK